jgi:hypothetical protein
VSTQRLADEVTTLAGHLAAATYRLLMLIGELDRRAAWAEWGCRSCAHWLNWQIGLDFRTGREHVRVAHRLTELPLVAAAFREGTISYSKVRALCRIANPATEADLVMLARNGTASHVERVVRAYRRSVAVSVEQTDAQHARRYVSWFWDDDGSFVLNARLPAEVGALVHQAITEAMEKSRAPFDERAADAFTEVIERALAAGPAGRPDRYQVMVHVEPQVLTGEQGECHLDDGPALATETARRIACDTAKVTVTENDVGVLDIGRRTRTIPASLRRALHVRDGGCRFPGCTSRRYTDGHHIQHWANGGPTTLNNLILLCRHHHRLVHEGRWQLRATQAEGFCFVDPHGNELAARPPSRRSDGRAVRHPRVDADTIRSQWGGERLDLSIVIEGLRWHDEHPAPRNRPLQN